MKSKIFLLGILIALFAISVPLIADPGGGSVAVSVSTTNLSLAAVASPAVAIEQSVTMAVLGTVALVPILFLLSIRHRAIAIPWRTTLGNYLRTPLLKVRRSFDKLTKSPVLKHQALAA